MTSEGYSASLSDQRECDREAIHLFSSIQPHGWLMAFTWPDQRIQAASENLGSILKAPQSQVIGARIEHYFPRRFVTEIQALVEAYPWKAKGQHIKVRPEIDEKSFDAYLYESQGLYILELEEYTVEADRSEIEIENDQLIKDYMLKCKEAKSLEELSRLTCTTIRRITGLDRVMMYRFLPPNWHGEVIAEDRVASAHSYLQHRFPASDIPKPARDLYLRNQVRLISNVGAEPVKIAPPLNPLTKKALDLSDSRLRSVASVHMEYLKNMKVGASFSVAVTDREMLWGLIAGHHMSPCHISQSRRTACEIIAHSFAIQAPLYEEVGSRNERLEFELRLKKVVESIRSSTDPINQFFKQHRTVTETFHAQGMALVGESLVDFAGLTPLRADVEKLAHWCRDKMLERHDTVLAVESLAEADPQWASLSSIVTGVLAVLMTELNNSVLLLFRPELVRTVTWGGDPRKQLEKRGFQGQINPRASFEAWEEIIRGRSEPWKRHEIEGLAFVRDLVFDGLVKKEQLIQELSKTRR